MLHLNTKNCLTVGYVSGLWIRNFFADPDPQVWTLHYVVVVM